MSQTHDIYAVNTQVNRLTELIRTEAQPRKAFSQAMEPPRGDAMGKNMGAITQYTFAPNIETQGGQLVEVEDIPQSELDPKKRLFEVQEYGNSLRWTGKLQDLNKLDLESVWMQALLNDFQKSQNIRAYDAVKETDYVFVVDSTDATDGLEFVTNGTPTQTADGPLTLALLGRLTVEAKKQDIPYWDGESYLLITGPDQIEDLASDSTLSTLLSRDSGRDSLNSEFGRIKQCRIIEDTHKVAKISGILDEYFLLGADSIAHEIACPVEMRLEDRNYQRFYGLAWYTIDAIFKIMDQTDFSQEHIIRGGSA